MGKKKKKKVIPLTDLEKIDSGIERLTHIETENLSPRAIEIAFKDTIEVLRELLPIIRKYETENGILVKR